MARLYGTVEFLCVCVCVFAVQLFKNELSKYDARFICTQFTTSLL